MHFYLKKKSINKHSLSFNFKYYTWLHACVYIRTWVHSSSSGSVAQGISEKDQRKEGIERLPLPVI